MSDDPRFSFRYRSTGGRVFFRQVYWEELYLFRYGETQILVAARVVPSTNLLESLYDSMRDVETRQELSGYIEPPSEPGADTIAPHDPIESAVRSVSNEVVGEASSRSADELMSAASETGCQY